MFGDTQEGLFLGLITVLNVIIGCTQEISAWLTLEKLQLSAAPKVVRVSIEGVEEIVSLEEIKEKDNLKLKTGDQVPCDGMLVSSHGFEVSEAFITGESKAYLKKPGDKILAGSVVTSGSGVEDVEKIFAESRIAIMTKSVKKYSLIQSPIQYSINTVIKYMGYVLLLIILFVGVRGFLINESTVNIIQNIGALTSVLLPQGMVVVITLLFSYGAAHLYRRQVLLQEANATEKLGRIKNLCMDKTGTLTGNDLTVEHFYIAPGVDENYAKESIAAYIKITEDVSQTINVIKKRFSNVYAGTIIDDLTFSSSRQFGAVHMKDSFGERVMLAGAPDVFLPYFSIAQDKEWVQRYIDTEARIGKRILCFAQSTTNVLPTDLSGITLSPLSLIVINHNLREGVIEAVKFFQDRGVVIRIISGDNPETVQAVARAAGVSTPQSVIIGAELETWTATDFLEKAHTYTVFARIKPEQKEKIIEALKQDGFTAMIGDGANDALAIKKADLGIAMFDGAQATRQIASVVLVKNSFTDLPNGVKLADSIIQNIEICAALFFNGAFLGFFFFILLTVFGYSFPFTPLNITFLTYFTIGLPVTLIFYWVIRPVHAHVTKPDTSFLRRVIPFALASAIPQSIVTAIAFYSSLENVKIHAPTTLVVLSFIVVGVVFFMHTPSVYSGPMTKNQKIQFYGLVFVECISVIVLINIPFVTSFYNLTIPSLREVIELVPLVLLYVLVQYVLARRFSISQFRAASSI
jgi:cation-transporting ATPase E